MYVRQHFNNKYLIVLILYIAASLLAVFTLPAPSSAQSAGDCDNNAVIRCGTQSIAELKQRYREDRSVQVIFSSLGVSSAEINGMNRENTKNGSVTKDGRVLINGETVATDGMTAGRQDMPGSQKVVRNGVTFFKRPPSASFAQDRLDAFVVMKDGQYQFAVIKSCGNAVQAVPKKRPQQPVTREVPKPKPTPPAPAPAAPVQQQQQQQQQQAVVIEQQPVQVVEREVVQAPVSAPQPQGKELPDTGPGQALGASAVVGLGSTVWYMVFSRLRSFFL